MDAIAQLEERLGRYPAERYPVQHATAQFHLGVELTNRGRAEEAVHALRAAVELFDRDGLRSERAKALNALGVALRLAGRVDEAADTFNEAAAGLAGAERGAALYNLGLAKRDAGDLDAARAAFERASESLDSPAVARELGTTLLQQGELDAAVALLGDASEQGDEAARGAAANALGLAQLAAGRFDAAVDAFRRAPAAPPRTLRPTEYAMTKANLALAYERAGDERRARLAARQALGVHSIPVAIATQARDVLARVGEGEHDLVSLLEDEPRERWPAVVREEVVRWADTDDKRAELAEWVAGLCSRPDDAVDLAEAWLAALLELPPEQMAVLAQATPRQSEWFRDVVASACARFHTPQLLRLREAFRWS